MKKYLLGMTIAFFALEMAGLGRIAFRELTGTGPVGGHPGLNSLDRLMGFLHLVVLVGHGLAGFLFARQEANLGFRIMIGSGAVLFVSGAVPVAMSSFVLAGCLFWMGNDPDFSLDLAFGTARAAVPPARGASAIRYGRTGAWHRPRRAATGSPA